MVKQLKKIAILYLLSFMLDAVRHIACSAEAFSVQRGFINSIWKIVWVQGKVVYFTNSPETVV